MFEIKTDPNSPHHYLISVGVHTVQSATPGKMFMKHGPLYFSNDDVVKMQGASIMSKDKLFKTSSKQALKNFGCTELAISISGMSLAAAANQCTIHHFSSPIKLDEKWFENLVDLANTSEYNQKLLKESRIRY